MSVLYFALGLIAVYAAIVTAMYLGQTWLLFPTVLARIARVQRKRDLMTALGYAAMR